jgi:Flp pilus assembly protein TadG
MKVGMGRRWKGWDERGQALVEFALVMPLMLALLVGAIEFGRGFFYWLDLGHLANTGGRMAVVDKWPGCTTKTSACVDTPPNNCGKIVAPATTPDECTLQTYLRQQANTSDLVSKATVEVCFVGKLPADATVGDPVRVTVKVPYSWFNLLGHTLVSYTIKSSTTMRLEQAPVRLSGGSKCVGT